MKTRIKSRKNHPKINPKIQAIAIVRTKPIPARKERGGIPGAKKLKANTGVIYARI
jgi:hypothetical protein